MPDMSGDVIHGHRCHERGLIMYGGKQIESLLTYDQYEDVRRCIDDDLRAIAMMMFNDRFGDDENGK